MSEMWRLFIALELPGEVITRVREEQDRLKQRIAAGTVRWVKPEGIHLTLKFLDDVPTVKRESLEKALARAATSHASFSLSTGELGCFPNTRRPRVIWLGVGGDKLQLDSLRDSVEEHIAPLGFPTEDRPFNPHLTLGRVRREATAPAIQQTGDIVTNYPAPPAAHWPVTRVTLFRSELTRAGAVYTALYHADLKPTS